MRRSALLQLVDGHWSELLVVAVVAAVGLALLGQPLPALVALVALIAIQYVLVQRRGAARDRAAVSANVWQERAQGLREAARSDPESGLGSRTQLLHDWGVMAARYERMGEPFAGVLIELRHTVRRDAPLAAGAVTALAAALRELTSPEDSLARLDGHSFAVLFGGADRAGAREWLADLAGRIAEEGGPFAELDLAAGAAAHEQGSDSLLALLRAADVDAGSGRARGAVA